MSKPFKLRISKVITSFHSCRSKDPSTLPQEPTPSFLRLSPATHHHHRSSFKRQVSSAFGCGSGCQPDSDPDFHWQKEDKWHVVALVQNPDPTTPRRKIYNSSASADSDTNTSAPFPPKKRPTKKKKKTRIRLRTSTSSADSELFSSTETLISISSPTSPTPKPQTKTKKIIKSSKSHKTRTITMNESAETLISSPNPRARTKKTGKTSTSRKTRNRTRKYCRWVDNEAATSPARLSVFKRLIPCTVDGKMRESYAVVKKSSDPLEDFRRSMIEMVIEKQIFEERELEQLLQCFLSLNCRQHHGVIVEAFAQIWEAMFCRGGSGRRREQASFG